MQAKCKHCRQSTRVNTWLCECGVTWPSCHLHREGGFRCHPPAHRRKTNTTAGGTRTRTPALGEPLPHGRAARQPNGRAARDPDGHPARHPIARVARDPNVVPRPLWLHSGATPAVAPAQGQDLRKRARMKDPPTLLCTQRVSYETLPIANLSRAARDPIGHPVREHFALPVRPPKRPRDEALPPERAALDPTGQPGRDSAALAVQDPRGEPRTKWQGANASAASTSIFQALARLNKSG